MEETATDENESLRADNEMVVATPVTARKRGKFRVMSVARQGRTTGQTLVGSAKAVRRSTDASMQLHLQH